ncbi:MAG: AraC family transcriptional regulator [Aquabacterium sp.]|nr:MAG: AraC family transcriptional regulator [Aquabacterium sp.]
MVRRPRIRVGEGSGKQLHCSKRRCFRECPPRTACFSFPAITFPGAPPAMRYFNVESVRLMCELMRSHGIAPQPALDAAGIAPALLDDPSARIAGSAELAFLRLFRRQMGGVGALAVEVGRRYRLATLGPLGLAALSAPTVAASLQVIVRYQGLSFSWLGFTVEPDGDACLIRLDAQPAPLDLRDFLLCRDLAAAASMLRDLAGEDACFAGAALSLDDPGQAEGLQAHLRCALALDTDASSVRLGHAELLRANPHHSLSTHALGLSACEALAHSGADAAGAASAQVEALLARHAGRLLGHDEVASLLATSERSLRRRLEREGTSFRLVRERVLRARAEQLLRATPLSMADIAEQLGFSDASSFCQAFRRWTGQPPSALRLRVST